MKLRSWLNYWRCRKGHAWKEYEGNGAKRICARCSRVEWLFSRRFPLPGEVALEWVEMKDPLMRPVK